MFVPQVSCCYRHLAAILLPPSSSSTTNQYYTFVNKDPAKLHCFYTKKSTLIHGVEGEDSQPCYGQQVRFSRRSSWFLHPKFYGMGEQDSIEQDHR